MKTSSKEGESFHRFFLMDLRRSVLSGRFAVLTLLIPVIMILCVGETFVYTVLYGATPGLNALMKLQEVLTFDRFKPVIAVLTAALYTSALGNDMRSGFLKMCLSRGNAHSYVLSKVIVNALCICLSVVIGFFLFIAFSCMYMPLRDRIGGYNVYTHLKSIVEGKLPLLFPLLTGLQLSFYLVFLSTVSLWLSVWRPNRYLTLAVPLALFYIFYTVTPLLPRPFWVWYISSSEPSFPEQSLWVNCIYGFLFFLIPAGLCGLGCIRSFERRHQREEL